MCSRFERIVNENNIIMTVIKETFVVWKSQKITQNKDISYPLIKPKFVHYDKLFPNAMRKQLLQFVQNAQRFSHLMLNPETSSTTKSDSTQLQQTCFKALFWWASKLCSSQTSTSVATNCRERGCKMFNKLVHSSAEAKDITQVSACPLYIAEYKIHTDVELREAQDSWLTVTQFTSVQFWTWITHVCALCSHKRTTKDACTAVTKTTPLGARIIYFERRRIFAHRQQRRSSSPLRCFELASVRPN